MMEQVLITYLDSLKQGKNILILADKKHQFIKDKLTYTIPETRDNHAAKSRLFTTVRLNEFIR